MPWNAGSSAISSAACWTTWNRTSAADAARGELQAPLNPAVGWAVSSRRSGGLRRLPVPGILSSGLNTIRGSYHMSDIAQTEETSPRYRRRLTTTIKESLRELSIQLSLLNHHVSAHLNLNHIDLDCLDLIHRHGPLSPSALARRAGLHPATITGILDRLQRGGWITRDRDPNAADRRAVTVRALPDRGQELYGLYSGMNASMDTLFAGYTPPVRWAAGAAEPTGRGQRAVEIEVIIEIPKGSRNKYEVDHETGEIWLDRMLFTATQYPTDYGFVPDTRAEDGDPLDVLVLLDEAPFSGCHIRARPVGLFWMPYEKGPDAKVLCVPARDPRWEQVRDIQDLSPHLLDEIAHFFDVYKTLEPGKSSETRGWDSAEVAAVVIDDARRRFGDPSSVATGE